MRRNRRQLERALWLLPLAALVAWAPAGLAQTQQPAQETSETELTPEQSVLRALLTGNAAGQTLAVQYLSAGGNATAISERALALLRTLESGGQAGDPIQVQTLAVAISDAVEQALNSAPVLGVKIGENLNLTEGALGFDLGSPDSPPPPGFQKLTTRDQRLATAGGRTLRRPDGARFQQDGVFNVRQFQTGLPNGQWRVMVLTDDLGPDQGPSNPFGSEVRINGRTLQVAGGNANQWLPGAELGQSQGQDGGGQGGMLLTEATVSNGRLVLDFGSGSGTYITGIVLQPVEQPSIARLTGPSQSYFEQRLADTTQVRAVVAQALGELLTRVATAAGPQQLAQALQTEEVVGEPTAQVSEN